MKKKAALVIASVVAASGITFGVYAATSGPNHVSSVKDATPQQGQIQAPPHPPRVKPLERVVVTSK